MSRDGGKRNEERGERRRELLKRGFYMHRQIREFFRTVRGQELVEYSLILAFVCLAGAALYIGMARDTRGLWTAMNGRLSNANQTINSGS